MCGIAGIIDLAAGGASHVDALARMSEAMIARGPDDQGALSRPPVSIAARRLSIIDVEAGHQPISNEDDTVHVVMNGEIYNHPELQAELTALGHRFRTRCDTEVLVHGYEAWGLSGLLDRLNGMYAFALVDDRNHTVYIARDRVGIKPLVYTRQGDAFYFASTIAALVASGAVPIDPDPVGIRLYLQYQFAPGPHTVINGIHKVPPASYVAIRDGVVAPPKHYWQLPGNTRRQRPDHEWDEMFTSLFDDAVAKRMRSDVEVGVFLSGGLDSTIVLGAIAQRNGAPLNAFTVGFGDETAHDETPFARAASDRFGATLHHTTFTPAHLDRLAKTVARRLNEPIGDPACVPLSVVSANAAKHVKVVLTGEGADELFLGYDYYRRLASPWARAVDRGKRLAGARGLATASGYPLVMSEAGAVKLTPDFGSHDEFRHTRKALASSWARGAGGDALNRAARFDIGGWLVDDLLAKVDGVTMAHSIEARVPFLDHRIVEAAVTMPGTSHRTGRLGKIVLRRAFADRIGSELASRGKHGFGLPLAGWLRGPLRQLLDDALDVAPAVTPWVDTAVVRQLRDAHFANKDNSRALWSLVVLIEWFQGLEGMRAKATSSQQTSNPLLSSR